MATEEKGPAWKSYGADQIAVEKIVRTKWGDKVFDSLPERGARVGEEGVEIMQACGVDREQAHAIVDMVFDKKTGVLRQEVAGVIVTLLALCALKEFRLDEIAGEEIDRLSSTDAQVLKDRHNKKVALGAAIRAE